MRLKITFSLVFQSVACPSAFQATAVRIIRKVNQIAGIKYAQSLQSMQYNVVIAKQPIITR